MMKRAKLMICALAMLSSVLFAGPAMATQQNNITTYNEENGMEPRTDIKEWRYKVENGNLYKRLYNYSTGHWETDWIFVMSGVIEP